MRADPDRQDDLEEVSGSSRPAFEERPRGRPSSPGPRPASPGTPSSTPLLTATLNAPLQSFYSGGAVRVKSSNDLHVALSKKAKPDTPEPGSPVNQVFYSTLLKQLRQKAGDVAPALPVAQRAKKEKSKALPFQCPACKKRFQRHIAMNAHIQNEHISAASPSGERSCRLCGGVSASLAATRLHLLAAHGIDLDNPAMCLVEEGRRYSVLEASLRSGREEECDLPSCSNMDMSGSSSSSCSPAHTPHSSSESPERSPPVEEEMQVEDLSVRRAPCPPSPHTPAVRFSPAPPGSPRPESPKPTCKRPRLRECSPSPTFSAAGPGQAAALHRNTCSHCNIVYPNQTLYFLHKGFHSDSNPWRCNSCGHQSADLYDFNTHLFSVAHQ